ncbi:hypothetical protein EJ03DRAFT_206788 [Teratosphaeria nubilosa]|uniref:Uncharacterized protein n=1 Tax=Teratosphaeria nubilosa TaxID=161662 RepID=A0A6G1KZA6_9PEZI|nr:hypothetical protein EJ03DRAFT_206788 [Teratosphaeria nubilosa]
MWPSPRILYSCIRRTLPCLIFGLAPTNGCYECAKIIYIEPLGWAATACKPQRPRLSLVSWAHASHKLCMHVSSRLHQVHLLPLQNFCRRAFLFRPCMG